MNCRDINSLTELDKKSKIRENLCENIFKEIDERGLGTMSKTDLETLIFHSIVKSLNDYDEYELMRIFKVSPSKLRSLRLNESVKYCSLDLDDHSNIIKILTVFNSTKFETISSEKDKIRFYIGDVFSYRLMEKFLRIKTNSSPDYQLNPQQMDVKFSCLKTVAEELAKSLEKNLPNKEMTLSQKIIRDIREDTSFSDLQSSRISAQAFLEKMKNKVTEEGTKVVLQHAFDAMLKIAKHKFFGDE